MTAIILVNWNGADDTIACLESLSCIKESHFVVIADNNSTDDSVERIQNWIDENAEDRPVVQSYQILPLDANYGFAIGNNKALAVAMQRNPDYCMLLNNDTEVEPDFLGHLTDYVRCNPETKILSPCICFHSKKDEIWFCGGKLTFGSRKNIFANQSVDKVDCHPFNIDFVSGCALFFDAGLLNECSELLYNGFFFGEEDYEFSLRMKKEGVKMMCVPESKVYHKVGSSQKHTKDTRGLGRIYMYYHNRLVCNRMYESRLKFYVIWLLNSITCLKYFKDYSGSWKIALRVVGYLMRETRVNSTFDYDAFQALMFENTYFPFDVKLG